MKSESRSEAGHATTTTGNGCVPYVFSDFHYCF
jgi:hypothetical protein